MTAIRNAMTKAGVDTAAADLRARAVEALKHNRGDVAKAAHKLAGMLAKRRDLAESLVLDYVRRIAAEPDVIATVAVDKRPKDVEVRKHDRHRKRTTAEREAALRVAGIEAAEIRTVFEHRVNGRPIGDLRWGELGAMVRDNAIDAASFLKLGTEATANAILLFKVQSHAKVDDHSTLVRQVITAPQLQHFVDEAYAEAPRFVEAGMRTYAKAVAEHRGEIAP